MCINVNEIKIDLWCAREPRQPGNMQSAYGFYMTIDDPDFEYPICIEDPELDSETGILTFESSMQGNKSNREDEWMGEFWYDEIPMVISAKAAAIDAEDEQDFKEEQEEYERERIECLA